MNVAYNEINCADAAKMIGVDKSTVAAWCRKEVINCTNIGGGNKKGRYMISENEIRHLKALKKRYGSMRKAMMFYRKDWEQNITADEMVADDIDSGRLADEIDAEMCKPSVKKPTMIKSVVTNITVEEPKTKKFDAENIATTISYIQDIKERLNDIEAEKNQLLNELEDLRKEVMEYL